MCVEEHLSPDHPHLLEPCLPAPKGSWSSGAAQCSVATGFSDPMGRTQRSHLNRGGSLLTALAMWAARRVVPRGVINPYSSLAERGALPDIFGNPKDDDMPVNSIAPAMPD
jgi:hypothetical protein